MRCGYACALRMRPWALFQSKACPVFPRANDRERPIRISTSTYPYPDVYLFTSHGASMRQSGVFYPKERGGRLFGEGVYTAVCL